MVAWDKVVADGMERDGRSVPLSDKGTSSKTGTQRRTWTRDVS